MLLRDDGELFEHLLADALKRLAARAVRILRIQVVDHVDPRQLGRQGLTGFLAAFMRRNRNGVAVVLIIVDRGGLGQQLGLVEELKLIRKPLRTTTETLG